jgi:hypothetical protein
MTTSRDLKQNLKPAASAAAAAVWLHQGLWCKALGRDPSHREVLAGLPGLHGERAEQAARLLGLGETALAVLVATNGRRRTVAALQTALVLGFNAGGLAFGRDHIPRPARLLARNAAFLALVWAGAS